ncbi:hypothetical protein SNOG_04305 [Parastagonospora nodorum SN15]|uniref:Uncharacterized protein n=1 Tax=Phaeosphaeria nodorum (strain SN15 / ATCC MYA-4574 / FGSC 10173) TaxID=321614 RepID=Q0UVA9_PHANO|nr:hypothetical protein SNOG_04305 [Parastagonospora nodorum SN15]EAT88065.1 hypothetical protein SNOG_04305 [Parastagonospora nodorum SN15]
MYDTPEASSRTPTPYIPKLPDMPPLTGYDLHIGSCAQNAQSDRAIASQAEQVAAYTS